MVNISNEEIKKLIHTKLDKEEITEEDVVKSLTTLSGKVENPLLTLQIIFVLWFHAISFTMTRTKIRLKLRQVYNVEIKGKDLQKVLDDLIGKKFLRHPGDFEVYRVKLKNPLVRDFIKYSYSLENLEILEPEAQDLAMEQKQANN